jgi:hypothetical protein
VSEKTRVYAQKPRQKILFKNSILILSGARFARNEKIFTNLEVEKNKMKQIIVYIVILQDIANVWLLVNSQMSLQIFDWNKNIMHPAQLYCFSFLGEHPPSPPCSSPLEEKAIPGLSRP